MPFMAPPQVVRLRYQLSVTDTPITNVTNNCTTGSTALLPAAALTRAGDAHCALVLGFERMTPGSLSGGKKRRVVRPPEPH
jgi:acetyl-CoA acetyltransferase